MDTILEITKNEMFGVGISAFCIILLILYIVNLIKISKIRNYSDMTEQKLLLKMKN